MEKEIVIYVHGMGGNAAEADHYRPLFPSAAVAGFAYRAKNPWEAAGEFPPYFRQAREGRASVTLIANSIGAYLAMSALPAGAVDRALFISPIVDMEGLISGMMAAAGVTEAELRARGEIPVANGQRLSWNYLTYVRRHPLSWRVPTRVLYGEHDALTPRAAIDGFCARTGAALTVMPGGEHWFHTDAGMAFLDRFVRGEV